MKNTTESDILQDMEQFNRVLAALLILIVAISISIYVFSRLGILSRIFPTNKTSTKNTQTISPTPTKSPSITPQAQTGILGWFSKLGKANNTPTIHPTPTTKQKTPTTTQPSPTKIEIPTSHPQETIQTTNITIIPYGSMSASTQPVSGVETLLLPILGSFFLLGIYLRRLS